MMSTQVYGEPMTLCKWRYIQHILVYQHQSHIVKAQNSINITIQDQHGGNLCKLWEVSNLIAAYDGALLQTSDLKKEAGFFFESKDLAHVL